MDQEKEKTLKKNVTAYMSLFLILNTLTFVASAPIFYATHTCGLSVVSFVLSPIDGCEDFLLNYSTPFAGYIANGVYVAVMIFAAASYAAFFMDRLRPYLSIGRILALGCLATYVVSGFNWATTGIVVLGTSILGISLLEFLIISMSIDFVACVYGLATRRIAPGIYSLARAYTLAVAIWITWYVLNGFYLGDLYLGWQVHIYHMEGALAFASLLLLWIAISGILIGHWPKKAASPRINRTA